MSVEVYLLSISLARHRSIVPRPLRSTLLPSTAVREPQHQVNSLSDMYGEPPGHTGTMQRIDPG
jgi:hypothetical protein